MRLLLPLRLKSVRLLWSGLATSAVGDQLGSVALTWLAVKAFRTAAGYLIALQSGVTLFCCAVDRSVDRWVQ
jgi:MFS transporter, DHA3 family, macrolide efflux protein